MTNKSVAGGAALLVIAMVVVGLSWRFVTMPVRPPAPQPIPTVPDATPAAPADCLFPGPPPVPPNGATASVDDMRLGHDAIQSFVLQLEAYQACRNLQIDHQPASATSAQKDRWLQQANDAVDEANMLAAAFKTQLEVFRQNNPGK